MQPDVSFIIAAYNAEETIARSIQSALAQDGLSVEVIVADDCSSDATVEVARGLADARVRVVPLEANRGPGGARNAALAVATGRWIAVLDSDDTLMPDRLIRMISRAQKSGANIVVDNIEVVQENQQRGKPMFPVSYLESVSAIDLADFIQSNVVFRSTFNFGYMKPIFTRHLIESHALRYDETLRIGEDYIFLAKALAKGGRCVVEPDVGYIYQVRSGSISRVLELHHVLSMLKADEEFLRDVELNAEEGNAQAMRTRSLTEARSFLSLVGHLKQRSVGQVIRVALSDPVALRLLSMPLAARLKRLTNAFSTQKAL